MKQEAKKIKAALIEKADTLENAAKEMSDGIYSFNGNQLSKVINGHSKSAIIKDRISRYLGKPELVARLNSAQVVTRKKKSTKNKSV